MPKYRVLSLKPHLRLDWRGQDSQDETQKPDHSASLSDSVTSSTRMRFSVHTPLCGALPFARRRGTDARSSCFLFALLLIGIVASLFRFLTRSEMNEMKKSLPAMSQCKRLLASFGAIGIVTACAAWSAHAAQLASLQSYNVDINKTSVSGLSSGGYMAVQFEVAFSSMLQGAGVIAGGPYYCAQGNVVAATSTCSCVPFGCFGPSFIDVAQLIAITDRNARRGLVDDTMNLANHRIWMFSGTVDSVVPQRIMDDLFTYYSHYVGAENLSYQNKIAAEHAMPTDYFGNSCPTLDDCVYRKLKPGRRGDGVRLGWGTI